MAKSSKDYWAEREQENLRKNLKTEAEYYKEIENIYKYTMDQIQKEIDSFYAKYASKEGISIAEAKKRASKLDMEEFSRKAKKYVEEKNFSKQANDEMRLYNLTMKVNRLELLKAQIGLELVAGFDELQRFYEEKLTDRTMEEFQRQAGILGMTVADNAALAAAIVNASFKNATFSERVWMHQDLLRAELDKLLQTGLIQGRNPRELARMLRGTFDASIFNSERLLRTELARVQTEAQRRSYIENGFDQYTYITTGDGKVCSECKPRNGKHFGVDDMMPGDNAPPMHPCCRCSTAAYMDDKSYNEWLEGYSDHGLSFADWKASMAHLNMSYSNKNGNPKWPQKGSKISRQQYRELMAYAREKSIELQRFKNFDGDISVIKQMIDDAHEISLRFPKITSGKRRLTISLNQFMDDDDFAVTDGHIININANAFRDVKMLKKEYAKVAQDNWFVKGTNYRSIIRHEIGHVVEKFYGISGLEIAKEVTGIKSNAELMIYLENNLSVYASEYENGIEIISESFSSVFGGGNSDFALKIVNECDKIASKKGGRNK